MKNVLLTLFVFSLSTQAFADELCADFITISKPYVRSPIPGQKNSAAFMSLESTGSKHCHIIKAKCPFVDVVELHTHKEVDGVMQMRPVDKITVEAGGKTILKPGGLHVMLLGIQEDFNKHTSVPITLFFDDGSQNTWYPPLRDVLSMHDDDHHHHHHGDEHKHGHAH